MVRFSLVLLIACLSANVSFGESETTFEIFNELHEPDSLLDGDSHKTIGVGDQADVVFTPYQENKSKAKSDLAKACEFFTDDSSTGSTQLASASDTNHDSSIQESASHETSIHLESPQADTTALAASNRLSIDTTTLVPEPSTPIMLILATVALVTIIRQPRQR